MEKIKQTALSATEKLTGKEETSNRGDTYVRMTGCPVAHNKNSLTAGPHGPVLLQDEVLLEKITQFTREKIPARNVHALGYGAYGKLRVTNNDIRKYTKADLFSESGKETDLFVRFSGIFTEQGDADTTRDPRGFAIKFYTKEGNWDLLAINTPVFNLRDAKIGPDAIHAFKRDPRTSEWNPSQSWDFAVNHPESLHQMLMLFSDRGGTPLSFRHMDAYGCNTFSFVNEEGVRHWVKFHILSQLGAKGLDQVQAKMVAGEDPNFLGRDLRKAIDAKNYPKWKFYCQIMKEDEGYQRMEGFDPTKVWKHGEFPLIEIGEIELNRLPIDYFAEVEQVAFSPLNVVPGIGFSPDKLLQGRLLIYDDAQHHRVGPNFKQLPINRPHGIRPSDYHVGGAMQLETINRFPHYYPSNYGGPQPNPKHREPPFRCDGPADYYDPPHEGTDEDYYQQPRDFLRILKKEDKDHIIDNLSSNLEKVDKKIVDQVLTHMSKIDSDFGRRIKESLQKKQQGQLSHSEPEKIVQQLNQMLVGEVQSKQKHQMSQRENKCRFQR